MVPVLVGGRIVVFWFICGDPCHPCTAVDLLVKLDALRTRISLPNNLEDAEFAAIVGIANVGSHNHIDVHAEFIEPSDEPV